MLAETVAIARRAALQVSLMPEWSDVDSIEDLRRAVAGADPSEEVVAQFDAASRR